MTGGGKDALDFIASKLALPLAELNPMPLLTGDDLRRAGWKPGPHFRTVLDAVRDAQLIGEITSHEEALALLKCCVNDGEGIGVLTGRPGTGKTLLCHLLLAEVGPSHAPVFVANTHLGSVRSLLQAILFDLSLDYEELEEQ